MPIWVRRSRSSPHQTFMPEQITDPLTRSSTIRSTSERRMTGLHGGTRPVAVRAEDAGPTAQGRQAQRHGRCSCQTGGVNVAELMAAPPSSPAAARHRGVRWFAPRQSSKDRHQRAGDRYPASGGPSVLPTATARQHPDEARSLAAALAQENCARDRTLSAIFADKRRHRGDGYKFRRRRHLERRHAPSRCYPTTDRRESRPRRPWRHRHRLINFGVGVTPVARRVHTPRHLSSAISAG